eukprot:5818551-Ditylum_brightwellii.AAC.1
MSEPSSSSSPLCHSKRGTGNENNDKTVLSIHLMSQETTKGQNFNIAESSASYLSLNSAEATTMNESVESENESSVDHQTNIICSSMLDGIKSLCQLCTPMSVALEYHLTRSSTNNLFNLYSHQNEQ